MSPPPIVILVYFAGFSILVEPIKRIDVTMDVYVGEKRANYETSTASADTMTTSAPAPALIFEPVGTSIVPPTHVTGKDIG